MFTLTFRKGTTVEWRQRNPVLAVGEPGVETNTGRFKIGDGVKKWSDLDFFVPGAGSPGVTELRMLEHINAATPHPAYDDMSSLLLIYQNAKV